MGSKTRHYLTFEGLLHTVPCSIEYSGKVWLTLTWNLTVLGGLKSKIYACVLQVFLKNPLKTQK